MKRLFTFIVIGLITSLIIGISYNTSFAVDQKAIKTAQNKVCKALGTTAKMVMTERQIGHSMSDLIYLIDTHFQDDPSLIKLMHKMIEKAYAAPRFLTPAAQERAIQDFSNDMYLHCYRKYNN